MKPNQIMAGTETPITPTKPEEAERQTAMRQSTGTPGKTSEFDGLTEGQSPDDGQKSAALSKSNLPSRIPGYRMLSELGRGTFGEVWLAEDENTGVKVAIKFLHSNLGHQWQMLQAEVKQLALFQEDPGIVQLKDFEPDADRPYYVMAYAECGSLALKLKEGPMPLSEALQMFRRIAEAMAYVHARGIRHCDLKPGNILLDARGRPRIADFGQAHLASDMAPKLGTFFYMAPEQADLTGRVPGSRWDVYGLGALFYAMITGKPPYEDSTLREELERTEKLGHRLKLYREAMERAKPLKAHREVEGMDSQLAGIIERCLVVDPSKRYPTAEGIVAALNQRQRRKREKPILIAGLVVPLFLLVVLALFGYWQATSDINASRENLEKQAKEHFKVSADLAAAKVKRSVEDYLGKLVVRAKSTDISDALQGDPTGKTNDKLQASLEAFFEQIRDNENILGSCFVLDKAGVMIGIHPLGDDEKFITNRVNFCWRDYFHGNMDKRQTIESTSGPSATAGEVFVPIPAPHVSDPYAAADLKSLCLALSVPVKDSKNRTVGVLVANLYVNRLNNWLNEIEIPEGLAVLVDDRCHLVLHAKRHSAKWMPELKKRTPSFKEYDALVAKTKAGSTSFTDPVDENEYLVGYSPIKFEIPGTRFELDRRWAVLVQVKQESVIEPAQKLKFEMIRWGAVMLTLALFLVITMWLGLVWLMRREERLARI